MNNCDSNKKISSVVLKNGEMLEVFQLFEKDFQNVWDFYVSEREKLKNKADFYPYKQSELLSILSGGGVFLGGFIRGELAGVCGIDFDEDYQIGIKKANADFPSFPFEDSILEFSGLFVAEKFRKLGISKKMSEILLKKAKIEVPNHRLFAVVLESNIASMKNFFSLGFKLFGWWKMDDEYKFVYLISPKDGESKRVETRERVDIADIVSKLKRGYVFSDVEDGGVFLR